MKREIRYRVFCVENGHHIDGFGWGGQFEELNKMFLSKWFIFEQYTGAVDKHGKEICENDYVMYKGMKHVVQYDTITCGFKLFRAGKSVELLSNYSELYEVIGKVNQEL